MLLRLISIAARDLATRKLRSTLTVLGICAAVSTFVALDDMVRGFEHALLETVVASGNQAQIIEEGTLDFISSLMPQAVADRVAALPDVEAVTPALVRLVPLPTGESALVVGWPDGAFLWRALTIVAGRLPYLGETDAAVVPEQLVERLGAKIGQDLNLLGTTFKIVGIVKTPSQIGAIATRLSDLQAATFRPNQVTTIYVQLTARGLANPEMALKTIRNNIKGITVVSADALVRNNVLLNLARSLTTVVSVIALSVAILGVVVNLWVAVKERRHEIAILRAVGWPIRRIAALLFIQGVIIASAGIGLGVALGYFGAFWAARLPFISDYIAPHVDWSIIGWALLAIAGVSIVSIYIPMFIIARVDPATTLRST